MGVEPDVNDPEDAEYTKYGLLDFLGVLALNIIMGYSIWFLWHL
jgi:hypothetical protein